MRYDLGYIDLEVRTLQPLAGRRATRFAIRRSSPHEFTIVWRPLAKTKPCLCNWLQCWRLTLNQRVVSPCTLLKYLSINKKADLQSEVWHSTRREQPPVKYAANDQSRKPRY